MFKNEIKVLMRRNVMGGTDGKKKRVYTGRKIEQVCV
jgi:hypothetical protein